MGNSSKETFLESDKIVNSIFYHAGEGIIVSDSTGRIIQANPVASSLFGYKPDELLNKKIEQLVPQRYGKHESLRNSYFETPSERKMGIGLDLFGLRKDGTEFPLEISLNHIDVEGNSFVICSIVDISIRKEKEEELAFAYQEIKRLFNETEKIVSERTNELAKAVSELAKSKQELMRALEREKDLNKLKSSFVTTASHEFRTPLTAILSSITLISKYNKEDDLDKRLKHVGKIKSAVATLIEILNDFLSLSKLEEGVLKNKPQQFDIISFCNNVIEEINSTTKEGQNIIYENNGDFQVNIDKQHLKNILINLISNSIKYSPAEKNVYVTTKVSGNILEIKVADEGIGIPPEDQKLLFTRFFRAKNASNIEGTGLGLNIVKKYVDLMNGKISFTSKTNQGTTFTVSLPI